MVIPTYVMLEVPWLNAVDQASSVEGTSTEDVGEVYAMALI